MGALTTAHIFGTHVPVEEPSTASKADVVVAFGCGENATKAAKS